MIQPTLPASSPSQPTYSVRSVDLPTGIELNYVSQGMPEGVTVVVLHGLSDSWRSFEFLLSHVPQSVHAFAVSLRDHGDTGHPESKYGTSDFAEDVAAFMDMNAIDATVIVGHSMGSLIAQTVPTTYVDTVVEESLMLPTRVWQETFDALPDDQTFRHSNAIAVPTLLIWGDHDNVTTRADQDKRISEISGAQLIVYAGIGHAIHWEQPDRVASGLIAFVDPLGQSR